jgi:glycosyltransferase involved in cell wall biosynthesis
VIDVHIDGIVYAEIPLGGIARMWTNIIERLPDCGCRVTLYLPREALDPPRFRSEVQRVNYPTRYRLRPGRVFNPLTAWFYDRAVERMWSGPAAGVFHSTHFTTCPSLRIPQVVTVHDLFHERLPHCFSEQQKHPFCDRRRDCVEAADAIIAVSEATRADVQLTFAGTERPDFVVWEATDPVFRPLPPDELGPPLRTAGSEASILYIGTRYPYKNFKGLLAGFAAWDGSCDYKLRVIGRPPEPDELALIHALGLRERVEFVKPLPDSELVIAYNRASAVVMPSLSEGFGLPLWEAMACEVPVVSSRGGSLPEIGGDIPVYFDFGPPDNIAQALDEAVTMPRPSERLRLGRLRATQRTWQDVTRDYVEVYRSLVD